MSWFTSGHRNLVAIQLAISQTVAGTATMQVLPSTVPRTLMTGNFEMAPKSVTDQQVNDFQKALTWFRTNNGKAYMVLLD